jgi:hypothetical protein
VLDAARSQAAGLDQFVDAGSGSSASSCSASTARHDLIAVIYAWDARTARLRSLARQAELTVGDTH